MRLRYGTLVAARLCARRANCAAPSHMRARNESPPNETSDVDSTFYKFAKRGSARPPSLLPRSSATP